MATKVSIDEAPATKNIVLLLGDQMHIRIGMTYRLLTTNPIANDASKRKIETMSIPLMTRMFRSFGSSRMFKNLVSLGRVEFSMFLRAFGSVLMASHLPGDRQFK